MKEWHRTIILLVLLAIGIAFIVWSTHASNSSLVQGLH